MLDSADIDAVLLVAVDILNEPGCNGKAGLLGFDIGATLGAIAVMRLPLFKAAVFFYPSSAEIMTVALLSMSIPAMLNVAEYDPEMNFAAIDEIKEDCIESGQSISVRYCKTVFAFFANPLHEKYNKKMTAETLGASFDFLSRHVR
jgi:dienelactone hydrolase